MAAIFKDGRQKGIKLPILNVRVGVLDTADIISLTKNAHCICSAFCYSYSTWLMDYIVVLQSYRRQSIPRAMENSTLRNSVHPQLSRPFTKLGTISSWIGLRICQVNPRTDLDD